MLALQHPEFLWLLLLLLVPLLLYLLPMPRRQVATSALFLWERFLRSERLGRTSERFRRALGLALFLAILASLLLAAAAPAVGRAPIRARRLAVLVDASASMNAAIDGRSNLGRAKMAARQLIESLGSGTEVAVAEAAGELTVLAPFAPAGRRAARRVQEIEPFDGPTDIRRVLEEAARLWGEDVAIYVFTDSALPDGPWGKRVHAWIAPTAGDNAAIVALAAERRGKDILARFTLANYGSAALTLTGSVLVNRTGRQSFEAAMLQPGETAQRSVRIEEPGAAAVEVRLDTGQDALKADDEAFAAVPALEALRVRAIWPNGSTRNAYVQAVLSALQDEGVIGSVSEAPPSPVHGGQPPAGGGQGGAAATVFVEHAPAAWPEGGAIVLYPLRSGALQVSGLHKEPVTVTRQARHELLRDVDLRGLVVKGAVEAALPAWAEPLVWAAELPVVWAGGTGSFSALGEGACPPVADAGIGGQAPFSRTKREPVPTANRSDCLAGTTKVLFVGIPLAPSGSRLPFVASFPVLMRNALLWMLPQAEIRRCGDQVAGWTSRRTGLVESPVDGTVHAFSVLSAAESDLRRAEPIGSGPIPRRRPLAGALVALAIVLLSVEWGLFHRRVTE